MEKQKKINTFVICALMVVVAVMSIGYAALAQRLDIAGTATVKSAASSWNVYFSGVTASTDGLAGTASWTTAPAISTDSSNTGSNNKISFACELTAPGDSCAVTAEIKNGGTTEAKYTGYTFKVDGTTQAGTSTTLSSGAVVTVTPAATWTENTTVLSQNDTGTFVIKMELPSSVTALPDADTEHNVELSINFVQNQ